MVGAIEVEAARRKILSRVRPTAIERVALDQALGRRLAGDAVADAESQPFDNSAMDGFAVRAADLAAAGGETPVELRTVDESRAGHPAAREVGPGEAIAISTGAPLPRGADASVRIEDAETVGDIVRVHKAPAPGENVRRAGEDIARGETVLAAGAEIGPAELGALATIGLDPVPVHRRPRVAIVTSGDELVPPDRPLGPGQIHNSNAPTVAALVRLAGAEVVSAAWAADEPEATRATLATALEADLAIVCGGVSVGEHDHVKAALRDLGATQVFWRVALKPGGPTWFGTRGETLVFGLPGNPVSVMVTFLLLARPALLALGGGAPGGRRVRARLGADYAKPTDRAHAVRCRLDLDDGAGSPPRCRDRARTSSPRCSPPTAWR